MGTNGPETRVSRENDLPTALLGKLAVAPQSRLNAISLCADVIVKLAAAALRSADPPKWFEIDARWPFFLTC